MSDNLRQQLERLPEFLGGHLQISISALAIGVVVSVAAAMLCVRVKRIQGPVLSVASVLQTIPSLAMLALVFQLVGQIGTAPALIALVLYSVLPVLRNTVTGLEDTDPNLIEAARGIGMTPWQILLQVQLPLAAPVIIAGIRTATVWVVGIATLSTPVGATSLGNYIFSGLQTDNETAVLVGVAAAAALALVLDGLIRLIELAAQRRSVWLGAGAGLGIAAVVAGGLGPSTWQWINRQGADEVVIASKSFAEQRILAQVLEAVCEAHDVPARTLDGLGTTVAFNALAINEIDAYVDYSGTLWTEMMNREDNPGRQAVLEGVTEWLKDEHGIVSLGPLGFENAYALAMRQAHAKELGITSIADLAIKAPQLVIAGDIDFFDRRDWESVRDTYGLVFDRQVSMDAALMYDAVRTGEVDVISAYTTDARIRRYDLVLLKDPRGGLPPYDAMLLLSPDAAADSAIVGALETMVNRIDNETMLEANSLVSLEEQSVRTAAEALAEKLSRSIPGLEE